MRVKIYSLYLLIYTFLALSPVTLSSQPTNKLLGDVAMPSAEALSGSKYGDIPISYFTGVPNVSVDIHTITEGSLKIPLNLSYHGSGIKVGELASWVGSNWSMQLGMITRTVMGTPDDINLGYYDNNGDLVQPMLENNATSTQQMTESANGTRDTEPDLFQATMPGYGNIKWIFDKNNNPVQLPKSDFKIILDRDDTNDTNDGRFKKFTIISPTGVKFIFGQLASDTGVNDGMEYTYYDGIQVSQIAPSGWYLREVRSQDDKDIISYHYSSQKYAYKNLSSCSLDYQNGVNINCGNGTSVGTHKRVNNNNIDGFRLDSIRCSVGAIKFIANTDREDVEQYMGQISKRLDRVEINDGAFCKAYDFHYSYPESLSGNTTPENKRLRLDSLQEISCNGLVFKPKYKFEYFAGKLPDRYSKQIDHWGYFNGATFNENKLNIPPVSVLWQGSFVSPPSADADREPKIDRAKISTLQKIIYPTGGHSEFDFELNEVKELTTTGGGNLIVFGELSNCNSPFSQECCSVSSKTDTMTFTADQLNGATYKLTAYDFVETNFCSDPIDYMVQVTVKEYNQSTILGTVSFNSCADSTCSLIEPLTDLVTLTAGVKYEFDINLTASTAMTGLAKATFAIQNESQVTSSFTPRKVGGLRIVEFRQHDADDSAKDIVRTYDYSESETSTLSSGLLYDEPRYWGYQKDFTGGIQGLTFQATSVAPLTNSNGYTIGYRRVVENTNGSGECEYIFNAESVIPTSFDEFPYTPDKLRAFDGVELRTTKLNTAGDSVAIDKIFRYGGVGYEELSGHIIYRAYTYPVNGNTLIYAKPYTIRTGVYLQGEKHATLDDVTTVTKFDYDPTNHLAPTLISMTNSDGIEYITENSYIFDFPSGDPVYTEMEARNLISPIIESREKIKKNGVETQIGGRRTTYSPYSKTTGTLVGSCCNDADPYVNNIEDYEMTWDANGNVVLGDADGWVLEILYNKYDLNTGQPTEVIALGWDKQEYTWDAINKQRTSSKFINHEKKVNYYEGSSFISSMTEIDGQLDSLEWDDLMRPKRLLDREENVIHNYNYGYLENGDTGNFFKLTTDYTKVTDSDLEQIQIVSYRDGLNRLIQQVKTAHSPNNLDVIIAQEYDNQGRISKKYEPVESTLNTGVFQTVASNTPHTLLEYEPAPLNRLSGTTPPDWHKTTTEYGANTVDIRDHYNVNFFSPNTLNVQVTTDPDGNRKSSFVDRNGRVVLVRRDSVGGTQKNDTYTAYDPKNRKILVLPPDTELHPSPTYPDLIFTYLYDHLDQVIEHKIPDREKIETIYHPNRDYPVAWRGGNLKVDGKWMVKVHDDYGRTTQTGLITSTSAPDPFNLEPTEIWTKTFYDGESDASFTGFVDDFKNAPQEVLDLIQSTTAAAPSPNSDQIYVGKVHYTETAILDGNTASTNRLLQIFRYDNYGRADRIMTDNHLGGFDNVFYSYDFVDNETTKLKFHRYLFTVPNLLLKRTQEYDHQGRLSNAYFQKGLIHAIPSQQLYNLQYDHENQVIQKNLGGLGNDTYLQQCDYTFLENGFLSGINKPTNLSLNSANARFNNAPTDLFSLDIRYDTPISATARKNGTIAELIWETQGERHNYTFNYDYLDRLTKADYGVLNSTDVLDPTEIYSTNYGYDNRGNITELNRNGLIQTGSNGKVGRIDSLDYFYKANSNRLERIEDNAPCIDSILYTKTIQTDGVFSAEKTVISSSVVDSTTSVIFQADNNVTFLPGFSFKPSVNDSLIAKIDGCVTGKRETTGFVWRSDDLYEYDPEGNLRIDPNKGLEITYNYHNLPYEATFGDGKVIKWLCDANGKKLQKLVRKGDNTLLKQDYVENIEHKNDSLQAIYHSDCRVAFEGDGVFKNYQYYLKDYLGNNRILFQDNGSGVADVLQEQHYYALGMEMEGAWQKNLNNLPNYYGYNGKELDTDFGLNWYHYGKRMYIPAIGRFTSIDPLADEFAFQNPYTYAANNPILFIDKNGENPVRAAIAAYRYAKKMYAIYKKVGGKIDKITEKHFKDAGMEELYDIAGDIFTAFDKHSSGWDRAKAAVDIIVGTDFNKKGAKAVEKMINKFADSKAGVYYNKHQKKSYVGKTKNKDSRQNDSFKEKEDDYGDPRDKEKSAFYGSKNEDNAKEEEAIGIWKNFEEVGQKNTYNGIISGRSRVNTEFGGGKFDSKKDYK